MSESQTVDVECPECGGELGTNACLLCLYAYEIEVGYEVVE